MSNGGSDKIYLIDSFKNQVLFMDTSDEYNDWAKGNEGCYIRKEEMKGFIGGIDFRHEMAQKKNNSQGLILHWE